MMRKSLPPKGFGIEFRDGNHACQNALTALKQQVKGLCWNDTRAVCHRSNRCVFSLSAPASAVYFRGFKNCLMKGAA